jgi:prepilin-type N-terminal cleavage/methylation domain-containing protein
MRKQSEACISEQGCAGLDAGGRRTPEEAFTLVEMLIVVAIIAILSALTLPALQGLTGTSGLRGGVNTVMAALDQARAAAIENGATVYVGFPPANFENAQEPSMRYSSMIVFRGARQDESPATIRPLSRWIRLPSGIAVVPTNISLTNLSSLPSGSLPKLGGEDVTPVAIEYDRFGRIRTAVSSGTNLVVGEAVFTGNDLSWKGNNREFLTAQRLTGRWLVTRP